MADLTPMKRPTLLRTIVLLAGVCTAFWQAPKIVELVEKIRGGMSPAAALAGLSGRGQSAPTSEISLEQLRSALSGATANGASAGGKPSGEVVVFSPNGAALSEAERHALLEKANRLKPSGSGVAPDRISLPPGASSPPRPPATIEKEASKSRDAERHQEKKPEGAPKGSLDGAEPASTHQELSAANHEDLVVTTGGAAGDEPVGIHEELREMLDEIAPHNREAEYRIRRASRIAWRSPSLPRGPRPVFIIGPPGSGSDRIAP